MAQVVVMAQDDISNISSNISSVPAADMTLSQQMAAIQIQGRTLTESEHLALEGYGIFAGFGVFGTGLVSLWSKG
ncbi:MAG: hypothetical protein R2880_01195 [Deinococcales bacterium]